MGVAQPNKIVPEKMAWKKFRILLEYITNGSSPFGAMGVLPKLVHIDGDALLLPL